jgi:16S rRNA (adenine1518-N6/adenine1519-N6)-dimethyltransferase
LTKQQFIKYFPKKKLSQNYLTDDNICRKIVDSFDVRKGDVVLEIGAGRGAITKYLQKQSHNLTAVELDRNNCAVLKEKFPELRILNEDFLKLDFAYLSTAYRSTQKIRVIGNIPYNITSPILFKLIENRELISDALLMMQEEVARRLAAKPGTKDYGITSVFSQIFIIQSLPKLFLSQTES